MVFSVDSSDGIVELVSFTMVTTNVVVLPSYFYLCMECVEFICASFHFLYFYCCPSQPYLDELDLTEANRQALLLKRKSQGIVRNLSDSLSYHSIAS